MDEARRFDFDACRRAYEKVYIETGSFKCKPDECYSKQVIFPSNGVHCNDDHLIDALEQHHKGLFLISCGMYDSGPKICVDHSYFDFDLNDLNTKRKKMLDEKAEKERLLIDKAVPELIGKILTIDLGKCFEAYKESYVRTGGFHPTSDCYVSVVLENVVDDYKFSDTFYRFWNQRDVAYDFLEIDLIFSVRRERNYLISAKVSPRTFVPKK